MTAGGPLAGTVAGKGNITEQDLRETIDETATAVLKQVEPFGSATSFRIFLISHWALANGHLKTAVRDFVSGIALKKDTPVPCRKNSTVTMTVAAFR